MRELFGAREMNKTKKREREKEQKRRERERELVSETVGESKFAI